MRLGSVMGYQSRIRFLASRNACTSAGVWTMAVSGSDCKVG